MADLTVRFDRIGRQRDVKISLTGVDTRTEQGRNEIAEALYRRAKGFLASSEFTVTVDFTSRQVSIDGGRFGRGTIQIDARSTA